jgi:signal transduction histidine kinase
MTEVGTIVGGGLGLAAVVETLARQAGTGVTVPYLVVLCLLGLATTTPLAVPNPAVAAIAVSAACVLSLSAFGFLTIAGVTAQILVAYRYGRRDWPALLLGLPYLVIFLAGIANRAAVLAALVPMAAGTAVVRRFRAGDAQHRAVSDANARTLLEYTARAERARIARELHDVVAHHVSMIAVQAETARLTTPGMPPAGAQRLSAIGDTARAALTEMRRLLGVLREDAEPVGAERAPQPGLWQLNDLLDEARDASGAGARLIVHGAPARLDPGVELAAYRIVQEALTNARRHAPGAAVDVELDYTGSALRLLVRDNGPGVGTDGVHTSEGLGLLGMRERAIAVGGELRSGPGLTGGFLVEATLPAGEQDMR